MSDDPDQAGFGPPPPELGAVGIFRWEEISGYLKKKGIGGIADRGPLFILCQAYEDHSSARKNVLATGSTITSERGTTRNPDCLNVNNAAGTIAKLSAQLGLTPASRGKIKSTAPTGNDFDDV